MSIPVDFEGIEHRVIVVAPQSRKILLCKSNATLRLLRVTIPVKARPAHHLCMAVKKLWGLSVLILEQLGTAPSHCVVAELLDGRNSWAFDSVNADDIPSADLSDFERSQLRTFLAGNSTGPCARLGWIDEAMAWIERTSGYSPCAKDQIDQFNAGGSFALLRFPTSGGENFWLKATGAPNTHELRLTQVLSGLSPNSLPEFLAARPEWNAWLTISRAQSIDVMPFEPNAVLQLLGAAVETLAELQTSTVGQQSVLREAGAFDQRICTLRIHAPALFDHIIEAMGHQTSTKAPRLEVKRLREIQRIVEDACAWIESQAMPTTIIHNDMNLGNLAFVENACHLLDWAEGYVGHPLVTLQHLLLLNPIEEPHAEAPLNRVLKDRYKFAMREVCDPAMIESGFRLMPLLAAASALYGRGTWLQGDTSRTDARRAYSRMLARYMDRASADLSEREFACR